MKCGYYHIIEKPIVYYKGEEKINLVTRDNSKSWTYRPP